MVEFCLNLSYCTVANMRPPVTLGCRELERRQHCDSLSSFCPIDVMVRRYSIRNLWRAFQLWFSCSVGRVYCCRSSAAQCNLISGPVRIINQFFRVWRFSNGVTPSVEWYSDYCWSLRLYRRVTAGSIAQSFTKSRWFTLLFSCSNIRGSKRYCSLDISNRDLRAKQHSDNLMTPNFGSFITAL
jgi:hypothetical protein